MIVPLQPRPVEFGVDRGAFLECHIVDALRDEECVGEHPHRVRDDLVDPTTVAQELAALYVREPRPSVTVLPTGLVWKDPDHEVHGGEGELGLTQLQRVSVGRVSGRIRVVDVLTPLSARQRRRRGRRGRFGGRVDSRQQSRARRGPRSGCRWGRGTRC